MNIEFYLYLFYLTSINKKKRKEKQSKPNLETKNKF